jgi:ABC-2 type transport system permease protein
MSDRRIVWLVARRELRVRLAAKAFRISTAILLVAVVGFIVVLSLVSGGSSAQRVGLLPPAQPLAAPLTAAASALGDDVRTEPVATPAAGAAAVHSGDLDALVTRRPGSGGLAVTVKEDLDDSLRGAFAAVAREQALDAYVARLGGTPQALSAAVAGAGVDVVELKPKKRFQDQRLLAGVIVGILIYLSLLTYGQVVAQGVVEEKASRVVELLLSTIRAWQLMAGKVLGIGLVGLLQLALLLAAGVTAGLATGRLDLPASVAASTVIWGIVWYLLGFFLFALLFAAAGALVSRQEDIGGVTTPLMMLIILPYVLGISVLPGDPDNGAMGLLSIVPVFAPTLMPMRLAMGAAEVWEVALALVLTVAAIALLVRVTGRIYANAVMRIGARVSLRDALAR